MIDETLMMSKVKASLNRQDTWLAWEEYFNFLISREHVAMEKEEEPLGVYKRQGRIAVLRQLLRTRDIVDQYGKELRNGT